MNFRSRLKDEGPIPHEDGPNTVSPEQRALGVCRFHLSYADPGKTGRKGKTSTVYYLEGQHTPEQVLACWLADNPHVRNRISDWSLHQRFSRWGDDWREASARLLGPFDELSDRGGDFSTDGWTCPLCEENVSVGQRANHLEDHP